MIARVARAFGQPLATVARAAFVETVVASVELGALERMDAITRDSEGLQAATRASFAFHEPKRLNTERSELLARLRLEPQLSVVEARARARKMVTDLHRSGAFDDVLHPLPPVMEHEP